MLRDWRTTAAKRKEKEMENYDGYNPNGLRDTFLTLACHTHVARVRIAPVSRNRKCKIKHIEMLVRHPFERKIDHRAMS